ncbi:MAG TPA: ABC transporter ATP-binding protein [Chloroflexota bacterium]|nr:ABC transporter ATP-binding protein [Chloroflexota bacterium]
MSLAPAISVEGLRKTYGARVAVEGLSFTAGAGEVFALLGPNGAGKTTTIEILEGYRSRDAGEVAVLGLDPQREPNKLRQQIGLMLQEGGVYPQVRPREILALFASFYRDHQDPDKLLELVGLAESLKTPYRRLSGGQKQRLALALALVGCPRVVFLDEPTAGMDPQARRATWDIIRSLRESRVTVLLTTHYMDEAEQLADRIGIIDRGRLVAVGDMESLRRQPESADTSVRMVAPAGLDLTELRALDGVKAVREEQSGAYIFETTEPPALLAEVTAWARQREVSVRELRVGRESLEDIFLRLTGDRMRA